MSQPDDPDEAAEAARFFGAALSGVALSLLASAALGACAAVGVLTYRAVIGAF